MKHIKGDLIEMALGGEFDIIIHGCNCQVAMYSGFAKQVREKLFEAVEADVETSTVSAESKLGGYSSAIINRDDFSFRVINAYTQLYPGTGKQVSYDALDSVFSKIKKDFGNQGLRIGYPMIGAGLAGGNWEIISKIIEVNLDGEDHTFVEYDK